MIELNGLTDDMELRISEVNEHVIALQQYVSEELTKLEYAIEHYGEADRWRQEMLKEARRPHLVTLSILHTVKSHVNNLVKENQQVSQAIKKDPTQSVQTAE
ncbi:hypothetical protein ERX37_04870 [Macrococcus hajekii]|uniref:Uncharacterized protein n=1 Tax=Macrococcus hajekii TaxID=198482 RepID=A0A4R6BNH8_9STAP|nr:hypothetical protein [Macrococcus hajekii]TDM03419.1 hypothetical protein ERX37_04870 [Macrococcus hajekii]GGA98716.1 hypothetical protein GCM10007190_03390 [Macrococcus hajekii]